MNKLSIALLVAGAAAAGYALSKIMKNRIKPVGEELFDDEFDDCCCCDACTSEEDLDVVIPAEEAEDCAEAVEEAVEEAAEAVEEKVEEIKEAVEDAAEELKK